MARTDTERRLEALEGDVKNLEAAVTKLGKFEVEIRTWVRALALLGPIVTAILVTIAQRFFG